MKNFQIETTSSQKSMYQLKNHSTPEKPTPVCCHRIKDQKEPRDEAQRDEVTCPRSQHRPVPEPGLEPSATTPSRQGVTDSTDTVP